jgi:O-antigen ligase
MNLSLKNLQLSFCIAFLMLNSVWLIPGTMALRYLALFIGLISLVLLHTQIQYPKVSIKNYLPIILLLSLFLWLGFLRAFVTPSPELMDLEINTIWKRSLLEGLLGIGLGIILSLKTSPIKIRVFLGILLAPTVIFYLSTGLNFIREGLIFWNYTATGTQYYVPKYQFVLFSMIAFAWAIFQLVNEINKLTFSKIALIFVTLTVIAYSLFLVNGKNGFLYMGLILIAVMIQLLWKNIRNLKVILLVVTLFVGSSYIGYQHVKSNPVWSNLIEDIEVARHTDEIQVWKNYHDGELDELQNASGNKVSNTTYFRTAWLIEGSKLVADNPLGYGLIQNSFKYIAKEKWPDSTLSHTHSGWLDIILGLGIPGFFLILSTFIGLIKKGFASENIYAKSAVWVLPTIFLAFLTSELSEKISFEVMIFYLAFYCGTTLQCEAKTASVID